MLSEAQIERYARHILLREVGGVGQERLLGAEVRIEGLGLVGLWAATYLALAGVGRMRLADPRPVPASGLAPLLGPRLAGVPRDGALAEALSAHNPDVRFDLGAPSAPLGEGERSLLQAAEDGPLLFAGAAGKSSFVAWVEGPPCEQCVPAILSRAEAAALSGSLAAGRILARLLGAEPAPGARLEGGREEAWAGCPHR